MRTPAPRLCGAHAALTGMLDLSFAKHSLAGLLLCLPRLWGKCLVLSVTVSGESLRLVSSVRFGEGWGAQRYGELGRCHLLSPLILFGVVFYIS